MSTSSQDNDTAESGDGVMACTPYLCRELALPAAMSPTLRTILQCIAFALVVIADCLHLLFLVRAARTAVFNRSTITVLCLLSATQITFASANAPLVFMLSGWPETVTCKLAAFVTAWWRSATSSFLLLAIWQQYAGQLTVLVALCGGPKALETLRSNTSEAGRRLARKFPISTPVQVVNAAVVVAIYSLVASVYTVVFYDSTENTFKDFRLSHYFRLEVCSFDPALIDFARPVFLVDGIFSLLLPVTLASFCLASMRQLPKLAMTLFAYNKVHLRIVSKQLSTHFCDIAVPMTILLFYAACTLQHFTLSFYRLWLWDMWPFDTFLKCQRSSDVIVLLFPPVCAVLLHVWCRDLVRKENGLYDPGPSLLSMAGADGLLHVHPRQSCCESPPDYQPINTPKQNTVTFSPSPGIRQTYSGSVRQSGVLFQGRASPSPEPDNPNNAMINTLLDYGDNSTTPENGLLSPDNLSPDYLQSQKTSPCLITIETSL